jgi:hypothetical protein
MNTSELDTQLRNSHEAFVQMIAELSEHDFSYAENGKWSAGLQLQHINLSIRPLLLAFALPKFVPKLLFGTSPTGRRDYDTIVSIYSQRLQNGGKAPSGYVPKPVRYANRQQIADNVLQSTLKLSQSLANYQESDLDQIQLPHPLIGKLSIREMLYFTLYHVRHHHKQVTEQLHRARHT